MAKSINRINMKFDLENWNLKIKKDCMHKIIEYSGKAENEGKNIIIGIRCKLSPRGLIYCWASMCPLNKVERWSEDGVRDFILDRCIRCDCHNQKDDESFCNLYKINIKDHPAQDCIQIMLEVEGLEAKN